MNFSDIVVGKPVTFFFRQNSLVAMATESMYTMAEGTQVSHRQKRHSDTVLPECGSRQMQLSPSLSSSERDTHNFFLEDNSSMAMPK